MARFVQSSVLRAITAVLVAWAAVSSAAGHGASIVLGSDSPRIEIDLARGTPREQLAKQTLEQVLASHDLSKYTFTRKVVIEQGATNHAFPILTLNPYFASSPDELLSTFIHEQLHWHLRNLAAQQQAAITELRRLTRACRSACPRARKMSTALTGISWIATLRFLPIVSCSVLSAPPP